jgi:hypothetical protein
MSVSFLLFIGKLGLKERRQTLLKSVVKNPEEAAQFLAVAIDFTIAGFRESNICIKMIPQCSWLHPTPPLQHGEAQASSTNVQQLTFQRTSRKQARLANMRAVELMYGNTSLDLLFINIKKVAVWSDGKVLNMHVVWHGVKC